MPVVEARGSRRRGVRFWLAIVAAGVVFLLLVIVSVWRDDILEAFLDPQIPYAVYRPPPAPDYGLRSAWALAPPPARPGDPPLDVFFIHPTTFDGGRDWNGPIDDRPARETLRRVMLPNYAAPFAEVGRLYAPLYRQASLYTSLTLFDDAIEAREFAYGDVRASFDRFLRLVGPERPFILAGVEQGGNLASRLLSERIAPDKALRRRLVGAYLVETALPADAYGPAAATPACASPDQTGCVVAWISVQRLDFLRAQRIVDRARVWSDQGRLVGLSGREILCVNPLLGRVGDEDASPRLNHGAANATGLEWGVRPGLMARQAGAACVDGILRVTVARSRSLRPAGGWAERLKAPPYNLFWADLRDDATRRAAAWLQARAQPASPARPSDGQSNSDRNP